MVVLLLGHPVQWLLNFQMKYCDTGVVTYSNIYIFSEHVSFASKDKYLLRNLYYLSYSLLMFSAIDFHLAICYLVYARDMITWQEQTSVQRIQNIHLIWNDIL